MYVVVRRVATPIAIAVSILAGCGGGSSNSPSVSTTSPTAKTTAAVKVSLVTPLASGTAAVVPLTVQAITSNGAINTGTYPDGITVTSNDPNDIQFSSLASGANPASNISVTSGSQAVYVVYDGNALPAGTAITAATPTAQVESLALAAAVSSSASSAPSSAPAVATSYLAALYVTGSGASPVNTGGGAIPIFIVAQDQNGNDITGTFPSPIGVTLTDACDESLSINVSANVTPCAGSEITNVAALTVTSASEVVFVNYDSVAASSMSARSDISVSTSTVVAGSTASPTGVSIFCDAITFPYNMEETCEPAAGSAPTGPVTLPTPLARPRER